MEKRNGSSQSTLPSTSANAVSDSEDDFDPLLAPGWKFNPTDVQLITYYLHPKLQGGHIPSSRILEIINLYSYTPMEFFATHTRCGEDTIYFFMPKPEGPGRRLSTGTGLWKPSGAQKSITTEGIKIGVKRAFAFYEEYSAGKLQKNKNWIMSEYQITPDAEFPPEATTSASNAVQLDKWVLCKLEKRSMRTKKRRRLSDVV